MDQTEREGFEPVVIGESEEPKVVYSEGADGAAIEGTVCVEDPHGFLSIREDGSIAVLGEYSPSDFIQLMGSGKKLRRAVAKRHGVPLNALPEIRSRLFAALDGIRDSRRIQLPVGVSEYLGSWRFAEKGLNGPVGSAFRLFGKEGIEAVSDFLLIQTVNLPLIRDSMLAFGSIGFPARRLAEPYPRANGLYDFSGSLVYGDEVELIGEEGFLAKPFETGVRVTAAVRRHPGERRTTILELPLREAAAWAFDLSRLSL
jgi:hypothetical protein